MNREHLFIFHRQPTCHLSPLTSQQSGIFSIKYLLPSDARLNLGLLDCHPFRATIPSLQAQRGRFPHTRSPHIKPRLIGLQFSVSLLPILQCSKSPDSIKPLAINVGQG